MSSRRRKYLLMAALFAAFALLDLVVFGWWIVRSLSQRKIEEVLFETRTEAVTLADRIKGHAEARGQDLFTAVALERETQTYIDSVLRQRDIVETVEVRDKDGVVVLRSRRDTSIPIAGGEGGTVAGGPVLSNREGGAGLETRTVERPSTYDVRVPIGELGELYIGISRAQLEGRIAVLRKDLTRQAFAIGAFTFSLLALASAAVTWLWRRGVRLEEQATEAKSLAYVGTLASGLAHEIRNPLNSLNLNMQLLEEEIGPQPAGSRRILSITRSEIARLERLVTDFLSYARPRPLEFEALPAARLLEHACTVLAAEAEERGVRVQLVDRSREALVRVDRAQIHQALLNLIHNAFTAMQDSGRPPQLLLAAERVAGGRVALDVIDNGVGVAREHRGRIFEAFYSTRKGGTGLGLAIVDRITRAHGAEIEIAPAEPHGTRVRLLFAALGATASRVRG